MKEFCADKVAVVTGGASGIGLAMTELMLGFGAAVIIADINETKLNTEAARLVEQYPGKDLRQKDGYKQSRPCGGTGGLCR